MNDRQPPCAITSEVITVTPATYARAAMTRLAARWWWVAVSPMTIFLIASIHDPAYLFAAFIWLLMLLPPALMIAYYSYLLKPEAASMACPHRVTISPEGTITVTFEPADSELPSPVHPDIILPKENLTDITEKTTQTELTYRNAPLDILIIPHETIGDVQICERFQ